MSFKEDRHEISTPKISFLLLTLGGCQPLEWTYYYDHYYYCYEDGDDTSAWIALRHPSLYITFSPSDGEMRGGRKTKQKQKDFTNCQAPGLVRAASSRKPYVNWSSPVTLVFIYRIFQLCMTNFAQSHYLKQFVSMWEATPSPPWKVGGENVIIALASAWVIKWSEEFKREK